MKPGKRIAEHFGWPPWAAEIIKQLIDQPLHVLMCAASVLVIAVVLYVFGAYTLWQQTTYGLATASLVVAVQITVLWVVVREWRQWPSPRWYDPPLDWAFEAGGTALGGWLTYSFVLPTLL